MNRKFVLAFILLLNHSLLFGASQHEHHNHGVHVHLSVALPYSISFSFENADNDQVAAWQPAYGSMSYSPPVPPPNR